MYKREFDADERYIIARKTGPRRYYLAAVPDESLTRRELTLVLLNNKFPLNEIALAYQTLSADSRNNEIIFNILTREFVCCNQFYTITP